MTIQDILSTPFKAIAQSELGRPAVEIRGLSKKFLVEHDPPTTVASFFVNLAEGKRRDRRDFWAIKDVSMEVYTGETVGIIGPNGSGKSTLLKLMAGIYQPTEGTIALHRKVVPLLELGAGFHVELTGRENVFLNGALLGKSREEMTALFDSIVKFSGIGEFINTPLKFYSSGMKVRLGFAVAIHMDAELMLLDEIFAVGDTQFQQKCIRRIRQFQAEGRTLVLVSHGLDLIDQLCDRAFWIQHGKLMAAGTAAEITAQYAQSVRANGEE